MRYRAFVAAMTLLIGGVSSTLAANCDPIPMNQPWPVVVNGYSITQVRPLAIVGSSAAGTIQMNGDLRVEFLGEHVGTKLTFIGGSVGDVVPFVTISSAGGVAPSLAIDVPKTAGKTVTAPLYTRGVTQMDLVSTNHEGTLAEICSLD